MRYWAGEVGPASDTFVPNSEVDSLDWVGVGEARSRLSYPDDEVVLDGLSSLLEQTRGRSTSCLIILRHAQAMKRSVWSGQDEDRPLTDPGIAEADALTSVLSAYGIERIHSSPATRCRDTVAPYGRLRQLRQENEPALSESGYAANPGESRRRIRSILEAGGRSVVCSHRPLVPDLLDEILGVEERAALIADGLPPSALVVIHHLSGEVLGVERLDP